MVFAKHQHTFPTNTFPVFGVNNQIFAKQWMSAFAMSFLRIDSRVRDWASQQISFASHRFNMDRIYAMSNATKVVTLQFIGQYFNKQFIHQTVGRTPFVEGIHRSVAIRTQSILPLPTRFSVVEMFRRNSNAAKKASKKCLVYGKSVRISVGHIASSISDLIKVGQGSRLASLFTLYGITSSRHKEVYV